LAFACLTSPPPKNESTLPRCPGESPTAQAPPPSATAPMQAPRSPTEDDAGASSSPAVVEGPDRARAAAASNALAASSPSRGPLMRMRPITVWGRLSPARIQPTVRAHADEFLRCYEEKYKVNPNLAGYVVTRFVIGHNGVVSHVSEQSSTLPD